MINAIIHAFDRTEGDRRPTPAREIRRVNRVSVAVRSIAFTILLASFAASPTPVFAQGDVDLGRDKSNTCMGCHGAPGIRNAYPSFNVPKLAGQTMEYIVAALEQYKNGQRSHPTMQAQAASLSSDDIANIGAYYAQFGEK